MKNLEVRVNSVQEPFKDMKKEIKSIDKSLSYVYYKKEENIGGFAVSTIITGVLLNTFMEESVSKIFGGLFITAGVGALWAAGYSPIKITGEAIRGLGALVCFPYDYIRKLYNKKELIT